jgi:maltose/moltooligosaccharide transporter
MLGNRKIAYSLSLILGGVGFCMVPFISNQYILFIPYLLIGCAWAAMLAMPFTIVTNALDGSHMGVYLGLFNGTICIPQIVAASVGGTILTAVGGSQSQMLVVAGICLLLGACAVFIIKETIGEKK